MFYQHVRQLGAQPGIQLNPLRDNTDGFGGDGSDQVAALIGRFKRGRIDAPFKINRANLRAKLGVPEALRVSALNEAYVQAYEAVNNGAQELVVTRLITSAAVVSYAVFNIATNVSAFTTSPTVPGASFLFWLRHLECFNDGLMLEVTAPTLYATDGTTQLATKVITLSVREPNGNLLNEFTGSLDSAAVDEFGQDYFLGSIIAAQSDAYEFGATASPTVPITADCYGKATDGTPKTVTSGASPMILFTEGGTAYATSDYDSAISKLENGTLDFGYLTTGGSQAVALVSKMAALAVRSNRQLAIDVPGALSVAAAITWVNQLSLDSHYCQLYWAPLLTDDPVNGGKATIGTSGFNIGRRCARNAQTNAYGLSPKNYPVAGKEWPLSRTGIKQLVVPTQYELNDLALAKINPVICERYNGGAKFVFTDSLTSAKTLVSYRKLISVAEMSSSIDDMVVKAGKELLQFPMDVAIRKMNDFLKFLFDGARASGWLVASNDDDLGEKGYAFAVTRNAVRVADRMDVAYSLHYDGVVRAIFITQTLSR